MSAGQQNDTRRIPTNPNAGAAATSSSGIAIAESAVAAEQRDSVGDLVSFTKDYNAEMARSGGSAIRKPSFSAARDIDISGHTGLHIILPSTAARAASAGSLGKLKGCIVDMSVPAAGGASFASLMLNDIERSLIVAGRVGGPAHITGIKDSIVVVTARQVRIHDCKNVDFYLHCTSNPIIEDCTGLRFAPLPSSYVRKSNPPSRYA